MKDISTSVNSLFSFIIFLIKVGLGLTCVIYIFMPMMVGISSQAGYINWQALMRVVVLILTIFFGAAMLWSFIKKSSNKKTEVPPPVITQ